MGALVRSLVVRALGAVILPAEPKPGIRSEAPSELRADGEVDSRKLWYGTRSYPARSPRFKPESVKAISWLPETLSARQA